MPNSKLNIKFNYEYRDAGGYRNSGSMVFENSGNIEDLESIETLIREYLFDEEFFYPEKLNVPSLHFEVWNQKLDHNWYRFENLEFTAEPITDPRPFEKFRSDIKEFAMQPVI